MNIILKGKKELEKKLRKVKGAISKGTVRAINKTARKVKTQATKQIGQEVVLKAGYIKNKLQLTKATRNKEYAVISAAQRGILLSRFNPKQLTKKAKQGGKKNAGISIKVGRKQRRKKMRGAFLIPLKGSGAIGIAIRKKGAKGSNNFEVLHGPSVSQVWNNVKNNMEKDIQTWYYDIATHEIRYELKKIGFAL